MKKEEANYSVVRCARSGVLAGEIVKREGTEVTMRNARKLWYWSGACTVLQIALDGVQVPEDCKFTVTVPELLVLDAIEIIPCLEKAENQLRGLEAWSTKK